MPDYVIKYNFMEVTPTFVYENHDDMLLSD